MASAKKLKIPKSLAVCADTLYTTREERLLLQKQVDDLKDFETLLRDHLIANLPKGEASGIAGQIARVSIVTKENARVVDWDEVYKYISKNKAWELMTRRINDAAVKERWEAGEEIKGIEHNHFATVSLNKV